MRTTTITKRQLQDNHYVVTEAGAVWSHRRAAPKPLKVATNGNYKKVTLMLGRKRQPLFVHRLVCVWFHGEPPTPSHVVNHRDGNKMNNHKDNLEWVTQQENVQHFYENRC